jgi:hypothetical protein
VRYLRRRTQEDDDGAAARHAGMQPMQIELQSQAAWFSATPSSKGLQAPFPTHGPRGSASLMDLKVSSPHFESRQLDAAFNLKLR